MSVGRRRVRRHIDVWPGYVDVLSSLLILVIFVLMLFTFSQFLLSQLLSNQESELGVLHRRIAELSELLGLEQQKTTDLTHHIDQLSGLITSLTEEKFELMGKVEDLAHQNQAELEQRDVRIQALTALVGEREQALNEQQQLSTAAQAEVALLNRQIDALRSQLQEIGQALAVAEQEKATQQTQIEDLGKRLNVALARKVNRLEQYRSEFFGRLREVLADNPAVRISGDRFLFQSELLFGSGSATLGQSGSQELGKLAASLREVTARIPSDIDWILQVEGHTDRVPIKTAEFPSNWELSTARAVSVVRFLITQGIPANRLSAAGFAELHPIALEDTAEAYRKNRRIEIRLTSR